MISGPTPCFQSSSNTQGFQIFEGMEDLISPPPPAAAAPVTTASHAQTLLYHLSVLRDKVQQVQSLVNLVVSPNPVRPESARAAVSGAGGLIQEIIVAASSMMYAFQQAAARPSDVVQHHLMRASYDHQGSSPANSNSMAIDHVLHSLDGGRRGIFGGGETHYSYNTVGDPSNKDGDRKKPGSPACDIIELDAADLLAKYTHYCQICGKGFKRDANLRMHMRAHGDEYKSNAALSNPAKGGGAAASTAVSEDCSSPSKTPRKYSCPHEGCRWNKNHPKFQPLKSMICVKNHYKRSHCPKMYVCNRCNRKQFSVLSDLRTHEKHCGDLKWMCTCGTTFSRKDKLMGHVALFVGHAPAVNWSGKQGSAEYSEAPPHMGRR